MRVMITGGAGFIGSKFVRNLANRTSDPIIVLDKLTYAGQESSVPDRKNVHFVRGDIADADVVNEAMAGVTHVVNFAAETHVDRSITGATPFIHTNVLGTHVLLDAAMRHKIKKFVQISTDEVYGSLQTGRATEDDMLFPSSPYAASKASADLLALSYHTTHGLPVVITRSSNNYGIGQHPEKMIPRFITNLIQGQRMPVYGDGSNVRDWISAHDNVQGIDFVMSQGYAGMIYNIGGNNEIKNIDIAYFLAKVFNHHVSDAIEFVEDRLGHDQRYALDCTRMRKGYGWSPSSPHLFWRYLLDMVQWYQDNRSWWEPLKERT